MKYFLILFVAAFSLSAKTESYKRPELVCVKNSKSKNTCYYNFKIDGVEYQYIDIGCRYTREQVLEKIEDGKIALAKDWKVPCF